MDATQGHLAIPDLLMVVGYFVLMLGVGVYFYGRMRRMKDFFSGGNTIPWWLSGVSFYMSSFSVAAFVFYPGLCYRHGWVGITLLWVAVPAALFSAFFFSARWRRARIDSPVEYLETRYGSVLRQLLAWQGVPVKMVDDGIKLVATGTFISVATQMDIKYSILSVGAIILLYTFMGGLWAVTVTDFLQFVVLTVGVLVILPLSIARAGGMGAIFQNVPEGFFRMTSEEFGWSYVIPLTLLYALVWSSTMWPLIQRYYCVPTERDALKVGGLVAALYIIGPPIMFFPAIAATQFIPGVEDAGQIYPLLCVELLPAGMLGLVIAAMFAATMSTLSSDYNVCAGVLTNDVYKRFFRPNAGQGELVLAGRLMTLLIGIVALATGLFMVSLGKAEGLFRMMVTLFGIAAAPAAVPMLLGFVSKRVTNLSAILGFLAGTAAGLGLFLLSRIEEEVGVLGMTWVPAKDEILFGGFALKMEIVQFLGTALVTFAVMAVVSLLLPSSRQRQSEIDDFHRRLDTPIGELPEDEEGAAEGGAQSPFGVIGLSILLIGVLLFAVLPWVPRGLALALDACFAAALATLGGVLVWANGRQTPTA